MKLTILSIAMALIFSSQVSANVYELDKDHTSVGFKIRHLLSNVRGQFNMFSGTAETDEKGNLIKVEGVVKAASIHTNNKKRDEHLRSNDFFDVKKFADLKFVSDKFKMKPGASGKMPGMLTIHGITKPVAFEIEYMGEAKDPWGGSRIGATASVKINRKDFGLTWNTALEAGGFLVGDDVEIQIDVQAKQIKTTDKIADVPAKNKKK